MKLDRLNIIKVPNRLKSTTGSAMVMKMDR